MSLRVVSVPEPVIGSLGALSTIGLGPVLLVGGWAVTGRLRMAGSATRPTEDLDVLMGTIAPSAAALRGIGVAQDDPAHPCRLVGLPLAIDLLAVSPDEVVVPLHGDETVEGEDGIAALVPPFSALLVRSGELVELESPQGQRVRARLPSAGALLANKVGNLAIEARLAKWPSDALDVGLLLTAFGALALASDLELATFGERQALAGLMNSIGSSGMAAQVGRQGRRTMPQAEAAWDRLGQLISVPQSI